MKGPAREAWLAGMPGVPIVPLSWSLAGVWTATVFETIPSGKTVHRYVTSREAALWGNPERVRAIDIPPSALNIVEAIQRSNVDWMQEPCLQPDVNSTAPDGTGADQNQLHAANARMQQVAPKQEEKWTTDLQDCHVGDLPLLPITRKVLSSLNVSESARLDDVAAISRQAFFGADPDGLTSEDGAAALLDLTVAYEHWWPNRSQTPIWRAHEAEELETLARAIVEEYVHLDGNRLDESWVDAVLARQSWGVPAATLQQIGDDVGVTRERVRQILARLDALIGQRIWPVPELLSDVVAAVANQEPQTVPSTIKLGGFGEDDDWTAEEVAVLLEWFGHGASAGALRSAWEQAAGEAEVTREEASAVRKARSALGFLDLTTVSLTDGGLLTPEEAERAARDTYSKVFKHNHWMLVGSKSRTTAEGVVGRQFCAADLQSSDEIMQGLERKRTARQADQLPPREFVFELLRQCGAVSVMGENWTGPRLEPDEGSIDAWLLKKLSEADGGVLDRTVILRSALSEGMSLSSMHQYLSYSPIVRFVEKTSIVRLAGHNADAEHIELAKRVADALEVDTEIEWIVSQTGAVELNVRFGTGPFTTGIVNVDGGLAGLWPQAGANIDCMCDLEFRGRIRRYGQGNQLIGWTTLLSHLVQEHEGSEHSWLSATLEGENLAIQVVDP